LRRVEEAQNSKAPVQKLADTISSYFVPIVCLIAVITFVGWFDEGLALALKYSVAVFVVACPCALGLATPIAVITATGRGAREGILIKNANSLQKLASINVVLFDKTGTLTEGKPAITEFINFGEKDDKAIIQLAASGEAQSEHPLAHAFTRYAEDLRIAVLKTNQFKALKGEGIVFEVNDPGDYLPHADGTPRNKEIRRADMRSGTEYSLVDYTKPLPSGDPSVSKISFSDLKIGDRITVKSNENVKTAERFVGKEVRKVKL